MSKHVICHAHCPRDGGGGGGLVLFVLAVVVVASIAGPVINAAISVLEIAAIALTVTAVLAFAGGIAWVAVRARSSHVTPRQELPWRIRSAEIQGGSPAVSEPRRRAIEAPKPSAEVANDLGDFGLGLTRRPDREPNHRGRNT